MTPEQFEEIEVRVNSATQGPWQFKYKNDIYGEGEDETFVEWYEGIPFEMRDIKKKDAVFIAHARTDIPALLAEVDRLHRIIAKELTENDELGCEFAYVNVLRAEVKRLREALDKILIKVDWNSDEFHSSKQYNETRQIILAALNPKEQG